ncbi:unnamed protein product [Notodromas monacha]|uniref:LicD/FKTN/FKRP nucleotidyltransferase domain-containing protein n=1 Tax=Notodromas monacha TaxID=399045 RepID=A0A7R9GCU8_9CRUS|nr:unnamed protein product [Notodromas monacha]CAG0918037.1 unnamed protein product [Notodromas monacha]
MHCCFKNGILGALAVSICAVAVNFSLNGFGSTNKPCQPMDQGCDLQLLRKISILIPPSGRSLPPYYNISESQLFFITQNHSQEFVDGIQGMCNECCCSVRLLKNDRVPQSVNDNGEFPDVRRKYVSHLIITSTSKDQKWMSVVIAFVTWRANAKYFWVPGISPEETGTELLGNLRNDSVVLIRNGTFDWRLESADRRDYLTPLFIPCDNAIRKEFANKYPSSLTTGSAGDLIRHKVKKMLFRAKLALDTLGVPFWLSSGTCLGFFRQCDVIPYTDDVDIGVFASDYNEDIVNEMERAGFTPLHRFGVLNDSLQLSFMHTWFKLDIFFFYDEGDIFWNGGTDLSTGEKFKYPFPKFKLCWTEFLDLLVRVPCPLEPYIQANYGPSWFHPVMQWDWKASASNVMSNGFWRAEDEAIQLFTNH